MVETRAANFDVRLSMEGFDLRASSGSSFSGPSINFTSARHMWRYKS